MNDSTHALVAAHDFPLSASPLLPGDTPLHIAARLGSEPIVAALLRRIPQCLSWTNELCELPVSATRSLQVRRLLVDFAVRSGYQRARLLEGIDDVVEQDPDVSLIEDHLLREKDFQKKLRSNSLPETA